MPGNQILVLVTRILILKMHFRAGLFYSFARVQGSPLLESSECPHSRRSKGSALGIHMGKAWSVTVLGAHQEAWVERHDKTLVICPRDAGHCPLSQRFLLMMRLSYRQLSNAFLHLVVPNRCLADCPGPSTPSPATYRCKHTPTEATVGF